METCPVCRASLNGATTCRRCRADLQKVMEVEQRGQALAGAAMLSLAEGDLAAAVQWLARARAVHATPTVRSLTRLSSLAASDHTLTGPQSTRITDI